MLAWITENLGNILIISVLMLAVGAAVVSMVKNRRKGKSACGCGGCSGCPMSGSCHPSKK